MSSFYNAKRTRNLYDPDQAKPFKLSRSKLDLFMECPRCFYLDRRVGVGRPPGYPFNLNSAVDTLLKKEFDKHRQAATSHPLMREYGIDAIPYSHIDLESWRDSLRRGITFIVPGTNIELSGGIDDIWVSDKDRLHIVDYKATAKSDEVNLDAPWQDAYKRQIEVYQWLFRRNLFNISDVAYFVYCNGDFTKESFNNRLEFDVKIIPYSGDDSWVEMAVRRAHECLTKDDLPEPGADCDYCAYFDARNEKY
jgi:hypothetical protein